MIEQLLIGAIIILIILVVDTRQKLAAMKNDLMDMKSNGLVQQPSASPAEPKKPVSSTRSTRPATVAKSVTEPDRPVVRQTPPEPEPISKSAPESEPVPEAPRPSAAKRFEDLIGGKLPIWIGGIALIFAGFFLVRFSIEAGFFGPGARSITATLFGLLLIGLSEFGHKIPRFGKIFSDDARIGHSIAGAGIAVLYATLYMASELYGLLGLTTALVGVVTVTILAFVLSQRHGPPTALMGLIGGFAAPYVAGLGAESVAPLLIYLGVFTAGLFGLAIHRGWAWLALLATGGSVIWTTALLFFDVTGDAPFIGIFVVLIAIGGVLTLSRTETSFGIPKAIMQAIPLGLGLLQLIILAPLIEFSAISWVFFGVLSIFSIALAWKDEDLTPAAAAALGLSLTLITSAFADAGANQTELVAAIALVALFTICGHLFALREKSGWMWALVGLAAPTGLVLIAFLFGDLDWNDNSWGGLCAVVAATSAVMAWRLKDASWRLTLPLASIVTATLLSVALWIWLPENFAVLVAAAITGGLIAWAMFVKRKAIVIEAGLFAALTGLMMTIFGADLIEALFGSLSGETDLHSYLPNISDVMLQVFVPGLVLAGLAFVFRESWGKVLSRIIATIGLAGFSGIIYWLAKQPLAIGPIEDFVQYGFVERMLFTHILVLAGWLLLSRTWQEKWQAPLQTLGIALASIGLFRFLYFDIFLLSPTAVKQLLGPAPIANFGTLHYAAAAIWFWLFARTDNIIRVSGHAKRVLDIGSLLAAIAAIMVTVRQAVHGTDIATPPFSSTETYLYSAGLLALAIAWLVRGIQTTNALLRISGLLLLTLVTFKVFLLDARQLEGILRILSFLGLGIGLMGIGWMYGKIMRSEQAETE